LEELAALEELSALEELGALEELAASEELAVLAALVGLVDPEDLESLGVLENLEEAGPRQNNGSTTRSTGKEFPTATQPRATSIPRQTVPAWTTG
jgi:hypothetical protein